MIFAFVCPILLTHGHLFFYVDICIVYLMCFLNTKSACLPAMILHIKSQAKHNLKKKRSYSLPAKTKKNNKIFNE